LAQRVDVLDKLFFELIDIIVAKQKVLINLWQIVLTFKNGML
jgi:hypothetical protein